ncbi:MAG: type III-B CRISPR module-associated protein Cmr5 [Acidobacteria bacterium]|jgi:CRISPR-associated protein Cmr5|nr:type III-B CRISPR module-associated protein Cmr5 [Acidobacteriota bacterium]
MAQTLEQLRAQDAWNKCEKYSKEQVNIAKSLPALIMNSGLMQVLAFAHQKEGKHEIVAGQLRAWLSSRFPHILPSSEFTAFMEALMELKDARDYQAINAEAFAWLKWLRQLAAARNGRE